MAITVVSWNIARRNKPWRELVQMGADVALLQERVGCRPMLPAVDTGPGGTGIRMSGIRAGTRVGSPTSSTGGRETAFQGGNRGSPWGHQCLQGLAGPFGWIEWGHPGALPGPITRLGGRAPRPQGPVVRQHVSVDVHRERRGRLPEPPRNRQQVDAGHDPLAPGRVPQRVTANCAGHLDLAPRTAPRRQPARHLVRRRGDVRRRRGATTGSTRTTCATRSTPASPRSR